MSIRIAVAVAVLLAAILTTQPGVRAATMASLLMPELLNVGGPRPLVLVSAAPTREEIRLDRAAGDLYRPAGAERHGGLVITLGVHPLDKREPLVARFAEGLARAGLAVLLVQSDDLIADRILVDEPLNLVAAFERLAAEPRVDPDRVGIFGFSVGASLAFLAGCEPSIAERVRLVGWLGGYADALRLTEEIATASADGAPWQPHPIARYVFQKQLVDALSDPAERELLTIAYVADLGRGDPSRRPHPTTLGREARALVALFEDGAPVAPGDLPADAFPRLRAVSPIHAVARFRSRAYLMVDRGDPLVPAGHTRQFARALPPGQVARLVEFDLFEHVQPTRPLAPLAFLDEAWKLGTTVAAILAELDPAG